MSEQASMVVQATVKASYGRELIYVDDPAQAEALRTLTGHLTLTDSDVAALAILGVRVDAQYRAYVPGRGR